MEKARFTVVNEEKQKRALTKNVKDGRRSYERT